MACWPGTPGPVEFVRVGPAALLLCCAGALALSLSRRVRRAGVGESLRTRPRSALGRMPPRTRSTPRAAPRRSPPAGAAARATRGRPGSGRWLALVRGRLRAAGRRGGRLLRLAAGLRLVPRRAARARRGRRGRRDPRCWHGRARGWVAARGGRAAAAARRCSRSSCCSACSAAAPALWSALLLLVGPVGCLALTLQRPVRAWTGAPGRSLARGTAHPGVRSR